MIKALFFDIDGTLVSFMTHRIPESAITALEAAKRHGAGVYISTGRPKAIINNLGDIAHLIDGYITTNGAYCFCGSEDVRCNPIPTADVDRCVSFCDARGYAAMVVGKSGFSVINENEEFIRIFRDMLNVRNIDEAVPLEDIKAGPV